MSGDDDIPRHAPARPSAVRRPIGAGTQPVARLPPARARPEPRPGDGSDGPADDPEAFAELRARVERLTRKAAEPRPPRTAPLHDPLQWDGSAPRRRVEPQPPPAGWLSPRRPAHLDGQFTAQLGQGHAAVDVLGVDACRRLRVLPLSVRDGHLTVGLANLDDHAVRMEVVSLAAAAGLQPRFIPLSRGELEAGIRRLRNTPGTGDAHTAGPRAPAGPPPAASPDPPRDAAATAADLIAQLVDPEARRRAARLLEELERLPTVADTAMDPPRPRALADAVTFPPPPAEIDEDAEASGATVLDPAPPEAETTLPDGEVEAGTDGDWGVEGWEDGPVAAVAPAPEAPAQEDAPADDLASSDLVVPGAEDQTEAEADAAIPVSLVKVSRPPSAPGAPARTPLGQMLVGTGSLGSEDLAAALREHERSGDRLGAVLTHAGLISEDELSAALALQSGITLVDLDAVAVDADLARRVPHDVALRYLAIPYAQGTDGSVLVATADPLQTAGLELVAEYVGAPIELVVATDTAIDLALQRVHSGEHIETAIGQLVGSRPEESAFKVLSESQKRFGIAVGVLSLLSLALSPIIAIVVFNLAASVFSLGFSGYKLWLAYNSLGHDNEKHISDAQIAALDDDDLPIFTILMPMYREAEVVPKLVDGIAKLDYPRTKLDIKLLLEEDDDETLPAIEKLNLPPHFRVIIVPDALPKTKPKACNYGLLMARGDITVIYDAEDEPDPDQLKKVVLAFKQSDPATVCVQCKLNYYNRTQNLLTRWFTTEYSMWFDIFLPGLDAQDAPIPLGGTSNHFITEELRRLGAWDPHNVAEDADLGIRLNKAGWRTAVVDSTTYEEANPDLHNWIRQRSRWVKGYMQTYLVHMRHPVRLWRAVGTKRFLSFQMTVGGTFIGFLLNPVYWGLTTLWLMTEAGIIRALFPGIVYYLAAAGLFVGNFVFTYLNAAGSMRRGYFDLVKFALFSPVYWALMSWAAWKGAIQLVTNPHYWEKTIHGLGERTEADG